MAWTINLIALGADPGGTTDSLEILNSAIGNNIKVEIPGGAYNLSADNIGPPVGSSWWVEPTAVFTGAGHLTAYPAIPYQGTDVFSNDMLSVLYGTGFGGYGNIFARSTFVRNASGTNAVAVFGEAQQDSVGGGAWGSNFVGYSYVSGGSAIAQELNFGALVSGGIGNGLVLAASGGFPTKGPAIQIQANNTNAVMPYAIRFHERFGSEIANSFLFADGPFVLPRFLDFSAAIATTAELDFPSLKVGPTPTGQNGRLEIDGSSGTGSVAIKAIGFGVTPATVKNIEIDALGSGGVYLGSRGGGGNFSFHAINGGASTVGWSAVTSATPQTDVIYGVESYNADQNATYRCKGACAQTFQNTIIMPNLPTSGEIGGVLCATPGGTILYESGMSNCTVSRAGLKTIEQAVSPERGRHILNALQPIAFHFNEASMNGKARYGFTAENAQQADPRLATYDGRGELQGYDPNGLIAVLAAVAKDQDRQIHSLRMWLIACFVALLLTVGFNSSMWFG